MKKIFLEIIAKDIEDVKILSSANIDRIEFCNDLEVGGLTPDTKSVKDASTVTQKPLMVMLRKHYDTFKITDNQVEELINIINDIDAYNFTGYVFGAIKNNKIDIDALKKICDHLEKIKSQKIITFHKAFDYVENKLDALKQLEKFSRVKTVLTSGGEGSPIENLEILKELKSSKIKILIGGGVNLNNLKVLNENGFKDFHMGTAVRKNKNWNFEIDKNSFDTLDNI